MYCYCRSLFWNAISNGESFNAALDFKFADGEKHCLDWLDKYTLTRTVLIAVPFAIIIVSWISSTILRFMTRLEGYQSRPEEVYASTINMYYMSFVNTGIVIFIVYFQFPNFKIPFLINEFDSFSQRWYIDIGSTIVITVLFMNLTPHLVNLGF